MPTDDRVLDAMALALGGRLVDRRAELSARWRTVPPRRPGGPESVKAFVVHHTAGRQVADYNLYDDVWRLHCQTFGWNAPGYGVMVFTDGRVEVGVLPSRISHGVRGRNTESFNIVLPGNYNHHDPTPAQLRSLYRLLCALDDAYGRPGRPWRGHGEWALRGHGTACPGRNLLPHVQTMRTVLYGAADPRPADYSASP